MCAVQLGAQAFPWQLLCHSTVTRPGSPLGRVLMAAELPASKPASPHSSRQGQEQMPPKMPEKCTKTNASPWVLPTQPGAQHCSHQQLWGSEDVFKVTKLTKKIAKFQNPTPASKEYQEGVWKKAGVSLAAASCS